MIVPQNQGAQIGIPVSQPLYSYGQPAQGYGQMQQSANQALYNQMNIVRVPQIYNYPSRADGNQYPITITCPYCRQVALTQVRQEVGSGTVLASCLILIVCSPLFWIPCCMRDCQDIVHHCGICNKEVGIKQYSLC